MNAPGWWWIKNLAHNSYSQGKYFVLFLFFSFKKKKQTNKRCCYFILTPYQSPLLLLLPPLSYSLALSFLLLSLSLSLRLQKTRNIQIVMFNLVFVWRVEKEHIYYHYLLTDSPSSQLHLKDTSTSGRKLYWVIFTFCCCCCCYFYVLFSVCVYVG